MSFETAKRITPESFNQEFQFTRRPAVRYPVKKAPKQSVNISEDTKSRIATQRMLTPYAPKLAYGENGRMASNTATGRFLSEVA